MQAVIPYLLIFVGAAIFVGAPFMAALFESRAANPRSTVFFFDYQRRFWFPGVRSRNTRIFRMVGACFVVVGCFVVLQ